MKNIEKYKEVKENWIRYMLPYAVVGIVICIASYFVFNRNWYAVFGAAVLSYSILFKVQSYRDRKCPNCGETMKQDYSQGLVAEYHYCDKCQLKINTHTENMST